MTWAMQHMNIQYANRQFFYIVTNNNRLQNAKTLMLFLVEFFPKKSEIQL